MSWYRHPGLRKEVWFFDPSIQVLI
jgi:hypothetical protein